MHRQCLKFNSIGLPLNTKQISRAVIELSKKLEEVYDYLAQKLLVNPVIHMDETPFRVLAEKERVISYFWVMRTTKEFANHQIAVFRYANNLRQENIQDLVGYCVVLRQEKRQIKMRFLRLIRLLELLLDCHNNYLQNPLVTCNHNDYEFSPCCKRFRCTQKPTDELPYANGYRID